MIITYIHAWLSMIIVVYMIVKTRVWGKINVFSIYVQTVIYCTHTQPQTHTHTHLPFQEHFQKMIFTLEYKYGDVLQKIVEIIKSLSYFPDRYTSS